LGLKRGRNEEGEELGGKESRATRAGIRTGMWGRDWSNQKATRVKKRMICYIIWE